MNQLEKANEYIQNYKQDTKEKPLYHFAAPIGWLNDPNGFCYHKGEYHLFYQYYPYDVVWNYMHWGHATSKDLVSFKHEPVFMTKDSLYDMSGCFSGSAIEKDGNLYLMYTGHIDPNLGFDTQVDQVMQLQCIAKYDSKGRCEKHKNNPVIGKEKLPDGYKIYDFRDPKVYIRNGEYYCVIVARNEQLNGSVLLFKSKDLFDWQFVSEIYRRTDNEKTMFECPDLFTIGDKDVLVISIMEYSELDSREIINCVEYMIGNMDYAKGKFVEEYRSKLDFGENYYAPQSTVDKDGNRVIIGWVNDDPIHSENLKFVKEYGFNGMMTVPRQLTLENGYIHQKPIDDLKKYEAEVLSKQNFRLKDLLILQEKLESQHVSIELTDVKCAMNFEVFKDQNRSLNFKLDFGNNMIYVKSNYQNNVSVQYDFLFNNHTNIDFYIDKHVVEVFVDGRALTFSCYDFDKGYDFVIYSEEQVSVDKLEQFKIGGVSIE